MLDLPVMEVDLCILLEIDSNLCGVPRDVKQIQSGHTLVAKIVHLVWVAGHHLILPSDAAVGAKLHRWYFY